MDVNSLMMILVVVFAGFLIYSNFRRQKRQFQALRDMIASLKPGDEVMTRGGLYGKIVSVDAEAQKAKLEIAQGTIITINPHSIAQVITAAEDSNEGAGASEETSSDVSETKE